MVGVGRPAMWILFALAGIVAAGVAYSLYGAWRITGFPAEVNFGEGGVLYDALRLSRGQPIYNPVNQPPYWFSTYPPLFQWLVCLGGAKGFLLPRAISLASSLWCATALGLIARQAGLPRTIAFLAAGFYLTSPFINIWSALARVDMLGRAFEVAAVFCVWRWRRSSAAIAAAVVFATLAMTAKQAMIAGGLTCAGILWFDSRRRATAFVVAWVAGVAVAYGGIAVATGGQFLRNVFVDTARDMDFQFLVGGVFLLALKNLPLLLAAGIGVVPAWRHERLRVFAIAALAGLPSVLLGAHDGTDVNYYFALVWGLCGLAAVGVSRLAAAAAHARAPVAFGALALSFALYLAWQPMRVPSAQQEQSAREIQSALAAASKPVLTEFVGYGLAAGSDPAYLPYMYKKIEERGEWDSEILAKRIRQHEFGAILVSGNQAGERWSPKLVEALEESYVVEKTFPATFAAEGEPDLILLTPAK